MHRPMSLGTRLQVIIAVPVLALTGIAGLASAGGVSSERLAVLAAVSALASATIGVLVAAGAGAPSEIEQIDGPARRQPRHRITNARRRAQMFEQAENDEVASLAEALPQGRAFERGLAGLQAEETALEPPRFVEPPIDQVAAATVRLTRREPRAPASHERPGPPVAASARSPEEVRAMLARYRQGLEGARAGEAPPPEAAAGPTGAAARGERNRGA